MNSWLVHVILALVMSTGPEERRNAEPSRIRTRPRDIRTPAPMNSSGRQKTYTMNKTEKPGPFLKMDRTPSKVLVTLTGVCVIAGCSGVRVLPDGTAACSPEAIAETRRLGIPRNSYFSVEVLGLPGSVADVALVRDGPIEVRVTNSVYAYVPDEIARSPLCTDHPPNWVVPPECRGEVIVSDTALLYGEARLEGDRVQIRLHQLRDAGVIGPFCGVIAQRHTLSMVGLEKNPPEALRMLGIEKPPAGTVAVWSDAEVLVVEDENQKPRL